MIWFLSGCALALWCRHLVKREMRKPQPRPVSDRRLAHLHPVDLDGTRKEHP